MRPRSTSRPKQAAKEQQKGFVDQKPCEQEAEAPAAWPEAPEPKGTMSFKGSKTRALSEGRNLLESGFNMPGSPELWKRLDSEIKEQSVVVKLLLPRNSGVEWTFFVGRVKGIASDSPVHDRRVRIEVPALSLRFSVPESQVGIHPPPVTPGQHDEIWMSEIFSQEPIGYTEIGLCIQVRSIPEDLRDAAEKWIGFGLKSRSYIDRESLQSFLKNPAMFIKTHSLGSLEGVKKWNEVPPPETGFGPDPRMKQVNFGPPPAPPAVAQNTHPAEIVSHEKHDYLSRSAAEWAKTNSEAAAAEEEDTELDLYFYARAAGQDAREAIQLVANVQETTALMCCDVLKEQGRKRKLSGKYAGDNKLLVELFAVQAESLGGALSGSGRFEESPRSEKAILTVSSLFNNRFVKLESHGGRKTNPLLHGK